jgi:asparagine synthase (glutamine-hydrolysing)
MDHRLVEWALRLHPRDTWDHDGGKAPLRRLAEDILPVVPSRRKQGFDLPLARWMRGPIRRPVDELTEAACGRGLLDPEEVRHRVHSVRDGRLHPRAGWHLLVLEGWLQRNVDR